jgi:protein-tyrosine phosphatase
MSHHPDRVLPLQGATNFRDLGGYVGAGGRPVCWRQLFRSDHLGGLTLDDHKALQAIGLRRAFDFRGVHERAAQPYDVPGVSQHSLAIEPTVMQQMQAVVAGGRSLTGEVVAGLMRDLYRSLVNDQAHRFAELFEQVIQANGPIVFHCTAGKDRTGVAAALLLLALGVPRDVVVQDFLLTNDVFRHPPMPPSDTPPDALAVLWRVREDFLATALQVIDDDHGGVDRYLAQRLGVDDAARAALAARYLQAV